MPWLGAGERNVTSRDSESRRTARRTGGWGDRQRDAPPAPPGGGKTGWGGTCQLRQSPGAAAAVIRTVRTREETWHSVSGAGLWFHGTRVLSACQAEELTGSSKRQMPSSKHSGPSSRGHLPNHGGCPRTDMCPCRKGLEFISWVALGLLS